MTRTQFRAWVEASIVCVYHAATEKTVVTTLATCPGGVVFGAFDDPATAQRHRRAVVTALVASRRAA